MRLSLAFRCVAVSLAISAGGSAHAAYISTFTQVGTNVIETGSGSLNVTGLPADSGIYFYPAQITGLGNGITNFLGGTNLVSYYSFAPVGAPTTFLAPNVVANSSSGPTIGISSSDVAGNIFLPVGYISGTSLGISQSTYVNTTLANLQLKPGTYDYFISPYNSINGAVIDTFTIQVGPVATSGVPEPGSLALLGLGIVAVGFSRRARKR